MTQEDFWVLCNTWEGADDMDRERMLPFLTPKERKEMDYFEAETQNRCTKLMVFDFNKPKYERVIAQFGDDHRHWRDAGMKAIEERKKQLEIERQREEKERRQEVYKSKKLSTDFEIVPLAVTTPYKDVKQPKQVSEPKPKRERVSGEGGRAFEGFGNAEEVKPLIRAVERTGARTIQRREPKREPE